MRLKLFKNTVSGAAYGSPPAESSVATPGAVAVDMILFLNFSMS
jgi:hypothetical protein